MCLLTFWIFAEGTISQNDNIIIVALVIEHVYAYLTGYYRKWEIENYGQMDLNGIYRAPKEYIM